jgi:hypothetical protein
LWPYLPQDYLRLLDAPDDHSYIMERDKQAVS